MDSRKSFSLGHVIPLLIGVFALLDVASRFVPVERLAIRAWEASTRYATADGPFTPNLIYSNPRASGDLTALANLPQLRTFHPEYFSTDDQGFRVTPTFYATPPDILLLGDSFAAGSGVSDDQTLAEQLTRKTGLSIFNAGGLKLDLARILRIVDRLQMKKGIVIFEYMERDDLLPLENVQDLGPSLPWYWKTQKFVEKRWDGFWRVNPFQIVMQRTFKRLQNDGILPNPYSGRVISKELPDGQRMLFLVQEVEQLSDGRPMHIEGVRKIRADLLARGLELRMLLVPSKYTVYAPLLNPPIIEDRPLYLDRVEKSLQAEGIRTVNLLHPLREDASRQLKHEKLFYFIDDSHWNAEAIRFAAERVVNLVQD